MPRFIHSYIQQPSDYWIQPNLHFHEILEKIQHRIWSVFSENLITERRFAFLWSADCSKNECLVGTLKYRLVYVTNDCNWPWKTLTTRDNEHWGMAHWVSCAQGLVWVGIGCNIQDVTEIQYLTQSKMPLKRCLRKSESIKHLIEMLWVHQIVINHYIKSLLLSFTIV